MSTQGGWEGAIASEIFSGECDAIRAYLGREFDFEPLSPCVLDMNRVVCAVEELPFGSLASRSVPMAIVEMYQRAMEFHDRAHGGTHARGFDLTEVEFEPRTIDSTPRQFGRWLAETALGVAAERWFDQHEQFESALYDRANDGYILFRVWLAPQTMRRGYEEITTPSLLSWEGAS